MHAVHWLAFTICLYWFTFTVNYFAAEEDPDTEKILNIAISQISTQAHQVWNTKFDKFVDSTYLEFYFTDKIVNVTDKEQGTCVGAILNRENIFNYN